MLRIKMKDCYEGVITWRIYLFFVYACEYHLTMTDCKYSCKCVYLIEGFMIFDNEIFDKKRVWVRVHVQVCSSEEANPFLFWFSSRFISEGQQTRVGSDTSRRPISLCSTLSLDLNSCNASFCFVLFCFPDGDRMCTVFENDFIYSQRIKGYCKKPGTSSHCMSGPEVWWLFMCRINIHMVQCSAPSWQRTNNICKRWKADWNWSRFSQEITTHCLSFLFFIVANKSAQMGQNPTWREIMGEATKGNDRKGSWWERPKADHEHI